MLHSYLGGLKGWSYCQKVVIGNISIFCFPAHNELGVCKASLVSQKQSVLNSSAKVY